MSDDDKIRLNVGDLIEVSTSAVQRALAARTPPLTDPGNVGSITVGIIFQPPTDRPGGVPGSSPGKPTFRTIESITVTPQFVQAWARSAGELHNKLVSLATQDAKSRAERSTMYLTIMKDLGVLGEDDVANLNDMLTAVHDDQSPLEQVLARIQRLHHGVSVRADASPLCVGIANVIQASYLQVVDMIGGAQEKVRPFEAKAGQGVASADADGAVEGGGLGAIAGAEVGGSAGGVGALPGALLGGLIGLLGGGAVKSVGRLLDRE